MDRLTEQLENLIEELDNLIDEIETDDLQNDKRYKAITKAIEILEEIL